MLDQLLWLSMYLHFIVLSYNSHCTTVPCNKGVLPVYCFITINVLSVYCQSSCLKIISWYCPCINILCPVMLPCSPCTGMHSPCPFLFTFVYCPCPGTALYFLYTVSILTKFCPLLTLYCLCTQCPCTVMYSPFLFAYSKYIWWATLLPLYCSIIVAVPGWTSRYPCSDCSPSHTSGSFIALQGTGTKFVKIYDF